MFPTATVNGGSARPETGQEFSVSALVSVPGWWKTAHLKVATCWISEADLRRSADLRSVCNEARPSTIVFHSDLRLPGTAETLMQNLRFYVTRYPFLNDAEMIKPITVESGRPARIVIRGGRLWRSPIVTLGTQLAKSVEVLPDMEGIVAYFDCVLPEPGTSGEKPDSMNGLYSKMAKTDPTSKQEQMSKTDTSPQAVAPLSVLTSEGLTSPTTVMVKPFTPRWGEAGIKPCWPLQQKSVFFAAPAGTTVAPSAELSASAASKN
jgi:hypothetical protein